LHFAPGSAAGLAEGVTRLIEDADLRRAMGVAGRESVAACGWAGIGDELLGHYRDVRGLSRGHPADRDAPDRDGTPVRGGWGAG
jgi:phosphatidylinositol alpha 1,6-mannosyltransferase